MMEANKYMHPLTNVTFSKTDNNIISQAKISYFMSASLYEPRVIDYVVYLNTESKMSRSRSRHNVDTYT